MAALADGTPWRDKLLPAERLFAVRPTVRAMNWKVLVEQFLEGYHIRTTHKNTFYPIQYDDLNVVEPFGPNTRITFPYQNIERLRDRPESTWNVDHRVTYVYHLFPNVMVATFPNQVLVITIDPIDVDHTTVTIYAMVTPQVAERASANPEAAAGARDLLNEGGVEDNDMSEGVQRGLHAGANTFVEFGTHERDRALPRHPRRAVGVHPMSDYRAPALRAARTGHRHHDQPAGAHECHWAADTSGAGRGLGPVPRRRATRWSASSPVPATRRSAQAVT